MNKCLPFLGILFCLLVFSCSSNDKNSIPVNVEFKGEIAQYYSIENATVTFDKKANDVAERYETTIKLVLIRNERPFKIDPSMYNYLGQSVVGLGSSTNPGEWCMFVDIKNAQYDHIGTYCGEASKLFEHFITPGDTCILSFSTSIDNNLRSDNLKDVEEFLEGKQNFVFILNGILCEDDTPNEDDISNVKDEEYIVSDYSGDKKAKSYHFNKAREYSDAEWYDSAFEEYILGMKAGENACALGAAWCYLHEKGTPRDENKALAILNRYAEKDATICLFLALFYDPTNINGDIYTGEYKYRSELDDDVYPLSNGGYGYREFYKCFVRLHSKDFGIPSDINKSLKYAEKANRILKDSGSENYVKKLKEYISNNH